MPDHLNTLAYPRHLPVQLLQQVSRRHRLLLCLALLAFEAVEQGSVFPDFASQRERQNLFFAQRVLQFIEQPHHIAKFTLHRKRTLTALLAAGNGHVVEALPRLRQEKCIRTRQRQFAANARVRNNVAIAELRQNHFERLAKSIQNANRILKRENRVADGSVLRALIRYKRKLCLRVFGMDEERCPSIDVRPKQSQALV